MKIMSGLVDQEVREELVAKVPVPKLDEAIVFASSKKIKPGFIRKICPADQRKRQT